MNPTVSVIVSSFNRSGTLPLAVGSVLNQVFQDFEIIIVDDASTDNSIEVLEQLKNKDPRISYHVLEKNSGGAAMPKNKALEYVRGKYIATLDADDVWYPEKLAQQINYLDNNAEIDVVGCAYKSVRDGGDEIQYIPEVDHGKSILIKDYMGPGSCVVYRKELLDEVGLFDPEFKNYQDWDMRIRIAAAGKKFGFINQPLLDYIVDENSVSSRKRSITDSYLRKISKKHWTVISKNKFIAAKHMFYLIVRHALSTFRLNKLWLLIRTNIFKNKTF